MPSCARPKSRMYGLACAGSGCRRCLARSPARVSSCRRIHAASSATSRTPCLAQNRFKSLKGSAGTPNWVRAGISNSS
eukprot:9865967-Lingulodinium_polyedra.AAC.1